MYYEEFDNREKENNEFVDAEYEDINGGNNSSGGGNNRPPKKSGKGPFIALIIGLLIYISEQILKFKVKHEELLSSK